MKILNEFKLTGPANEEQIKNLIITDLAAKIGWIKGIYPNKADSETNLDILFRQLAFESGGLDVSSDYIWEDSKEIFTELLKVFPCSMYIFGKDFPKIRWYICKDGTIIYTLV